MIVTLLLLAKVTMSNILGGMPIVYLLHKSLGVVVLLLMIWRIIVIRDQGVPDVLLKEQKLQRILSKSAQGFIYILLLIVPLDLNVFGLISILAIDMSNNLHQMFHSMHLITAYALAILVIIHILGALYHYFWLKDKVLQSMLSSND